MNRYLLLKFYFSFLVPDSVTKIVTVKSPVIQETELRMELRVSALDAKPSVQKR